MYFGLYDSLKPILLGPDAGLFLSFCLGYGVMITSGTGVKYKGSIDCAVQIMKNEGFMSMMKGAGANILRGVLALVSSLVLTSSRPCTSRGEPANKRLLMVGSMILTSNRGPSVKERDSNVYGDHHCGLPKQKLCRTSSNLVDLLMIVRL